MKIFICSMLILALIITGTGFYVYTLDHTVKRLEDHIKAVEEAAKSDHWSDCQREMNNLLTDWEETQKQFKAFIEHRDTDEIYEIMHEMKGFMEFRDKENFLVKTGVLRILISHLPENEKLTLENIL